MSLVYVPVSPREHILCSACSVFVCVGDKLLPPFFFLHALTQNKNAWPAKRWSFSFSPFLFLSYTCCWSCFKLRFYVKNVRIESQNAFVVLMSLSDSLFLMNQKSLETISFSTPVQQHQLKSAICDYVKRFGRVASTGFRVTIGNKKLKKKRRDKERDRGRLP